MSFSGLLIPGLLLFVGLWGLAHRVDVYAALLQGASEGLRVLLRIFPALVALLSAVSMLRASGAMDALAALCAPVLQKVGIPPELVPLMLVAGDHALHDMAGEGPDSWKRLLQNRGHAVSCRLTGLGALPQVQALYVRRLEELRAGS